MMTTFSMKGLFSWLSGSAAAAAAAAGGAILPIRLGGREADLLGEAVGVLGAEREVDEVPRNPRGFQGKLGDESILILEFRI
jgi:hypothetical protein